MSDDFLPIARPTISDEDIDAVVATLRSGWLVYGAQTQKLESEFADMVGAKHALAVSSCTAGMHLALLAYAIGPGDEVITSPLTFAATANVIVHVGATPVLADICADDLNIDPAAIESKITPRTKAIMPVHYGGQPCRMDEILAIAHRHGLRVIEDAATAAGAAYKGRQVGALGDATSFSFYAIKNMTTATGQGGMVTTDDDAVAEAVASLRNHGLDSNAWKRYAASGSPFYTLSSPGFNYGMTDLQASMAVRQLSRLADFNQRRCELAARYSQAFASVSSIEMPIIRPDATSNWHLYVVRLAPGTDRDAVVDSLRAKGIGTAVHYLPIHYHPYYRERFGFQKGDYPVVEREFERLLSLPLFPEMTEADVDRVVTAVQEVISGR